MLSIFQRVKAVFKNEYSGKRKSFREGFRTCYELFEIGYKKTPMFGFEMNYYKSQNMLRDANDQLSRARNKIENQVRAIKDINEQLLKAKEELMELKGSLKDDLLVSEPLNQQVNALKNELKADKGKFNKIGLAITSPLSADEKVKRLTQLFFSWNFIIRPDRKAKKAGHVQVNKFIEREAAKAENNIAA